MKSMFRSKSVTIAVAAVLFLSAFSLLGVVTPTASAQGAPTPITVTSEFSFGGDTGRPRSHYRTFSIPSGSPVISVKVRYQRDGSQDIPIVIEVRKPGPDENTEGDVARSVSLTGSQSAASGPKNAPELNATTAQIIGCAPTPWRVRVRYQPEQGNPPAKVFGTISVTWYTSTTALSLEAPNVNVTAGDTVRTRINGITGPGTVRIRASWDDANKKVIVRLLKPGGGAVTNLQGNTEAFGHYSFPFNSPKLDFSYQVTKEDFGSSGNWMLEVKNNSGENINNFRIQDITLAKQYSSTFTPRCPPAPASSN